MKLAVFDLDGTLTKTFAVDGECFLQAFDTLGIDDVNSNWSDYEQVTDSGVMNEVFFSKFGRLPKPAEISKFVGLFVEILTKRCRTNENDFREIPGASSLLASFRAPSEWRAAIATGGWQLSGQFKSRNAGIDVDGVPAAFAEDGPSRASIVQTAIEKASLFYHQEAFEKVVSVGDAPWDVHTAKRLHLPFVGVGFGDRAGQLRALGASHVLEDYLDHQNCLLCLEEAKVPWAS